MPAAAGPNGELTPQMIEEFFSYIEWVFDAPLTLGMRSEATAYIQAAQAANNTGELALVHEALLAKADLPNHSDQDREALRPSVEDEYIKIMKLRYRTQPLGKWVQNVKLFTSKSIAPGEPTLTRMDAEAYAELVAFVLDEGSGKKVLDDKAKLDEFVRAVAAEFRRYGPDEKMALTNMSRQWASLRSAWPSLPKDRKEKLRTEWREHFQGVNAIGDDPKALTAPAKALLLKSSTWTS